MQKRLSEFSCDERRICDAGTTKVERRDLEICCLASLVCFEWLTLGEDCLSQSRYGEPKNSRYLHEVVILERIK